MKAKSVTVRTTSLWALSLALILLFSPHVLAQVAQPKVASEPKATPTPSLEKKFFVNILRDQRAIWTSPFRLKRSDEKWILPLGVSAAALIATDRHTSGELVENGENLTRLRVSKNVSQGGAVYTTSGLAAIIYLAGRAKHNDRLRETGLLGAEALINSFLVTAAVKTISQRQRPPVDNSSGEFFDGGSSFPSGHASSAWSLATIIAQEYGRHRPVVRFGVYGLATAVSLSRYTGRKHFLSDVLVGSALGYGIGRYVYRKHHDPALDLSEGKQTSRLAQSKLFPSINPVYAPGAHLYGARLAWNF